MRTIGLIAGMSWESSLKYYQFINELVNKELGGLHSAKIIMESVDFAEIESLQKGGKWFELEKMMTVLAQKLEKAGADCIVICTNTMHKTAPAVQDLISIPLIHIADATAQEIGKKGLSKVALLGTKITMEEDFLKQIISNNYDIDVIIPGEEDMILIDAIIFGELCLGNIDSTSRKIINQIISRLVSDGAEGIILGCTELPLLINEKDLLKQKGIEISLFDTTSIHAAAAAKFAFGK